MSNTLTFLFLHHQCVLICPSSPESCSKGRPVLGITSSPCRNNQYWCCTPHGDSWYKEAYPPCCLSLLHRRKLVQWQIQRHHRFIVSVILDFLSKLFHLWRPGICCKENKYSSRHVPSLQHDTSSTPRQSPQSLNATKGRKNWKGSLEEAEILWAHY